VLILSRKLHEEIVLGDGISITVVAIRGKQVRLGIKAPPDVSIRRDELEPLQPTEAASAVASRARAAAAEQ
jgi:carbon storage regulator